jgi:hypothetical protein
MDSLPAETIDEIIDYSCLYNCRSTALVCRKWLPRSRFHIFHTITLYSRSTRCDSLVHRRPPSHPCNDLYAIIQKSPHISTLITELHIQEGQIDKRERWVNTTPSLILVLDSLTNLKKLHLCRFESYFLTPQLIRTVFNVFKSSPITSLDLELCYLPLSFLTYLSQTCPTLKSLIMPSSTLSDHAWPEDIEGEILQSMRVPWQPCQLDDLNMGGSPCTDRVCRIMDEGFDLSCLCTFHGANYRFSKVLLHRLGGHLHHLFIGKPDCMSPLRCFPVLCFHHLHAAVKDVDEYVGSLEENTGLRSLHIGNINIGTEPWQDNFPSHKQLEWLKTLLLSIRGAQYLQKITLGFFSSLPVESTSRFDVLKVIDEAFDGNVLLQLDKVEVSIDAAPRRVKWEAVKEAVAGVFPVLTGRKLLNIM